MRFIHCQLTCRYCKPILSLKSQSIAAKNILMLHSVSQDFLIPSDFVMNSSWRFIFPVELHTQGNLTNTLWSCVVLRVNSSIHNAYQNSSTMAHLLGSWLCVFVRISTHEQPHHLFCTFGQLRADVYTCTHARSETRSS